jgi:hypothetical protein
MSKLSDLVPLGVVAVASSLPCFYPADEWTRRFSSRASRWCGLVNPALKEIIGRPRPDL